MPQLVSSGHTILVIRHIDDEESGGAYYLLWTDFNSNEKSVFSSHKHHNDNGNK